MSRLLIEWCADQIEKVITRMILAGLGLYMGFAFITYLPLVLLNDVVGVNLEAVAIGGGLLAIGPTLYFFIRGYKSLKKGATRTPT